jgi:hypothetical protein
MPNWLIRTDEHERFEVRIGNVSKAHAEQVLQDLIDQGPSAYPPGLILVSADKNFKAKRRLLGG